MHSLSRCLALVSLALAVDGGRLRAETSLGGMWETPLGKIRLDPAGELLVGKLQEIDQTCGLPAGAEVLHGRLADGVFLGEVRACGSASCGERWVFVMATPLEGGERLVGAVGALPADCRSHVLGGTPFSLGRPRAALPARVAHPFKIEAEAPYSEGLALWKSGNLEEARQKLLHAAELDPRNPEILNQIGLTYHNRGDYPRAQAYFTQAIQIDPGFADAHYNLGCALAKQGKVREALRSLRQAVENGTSELLDEDVDLDLLRSAPEYQEIRRRARVNRENASRWDEKSP